MAKDQDLNLDEMVETFRKRGVSCSTLKKKEALRRKLARESRKDGFIKTANLDEAVADKLSKIRRRVCLLK